MKLSVREITVKTASVLLITATILGVGFTPSQTSTLPTPTIGVTVHAAMSDTDFRNKVNEYIPAGVINYNPFTTKSTSNPRYSDITANYKAMQLVEANKDQLKALATEVFSDVKPTDWYAHLITLSKYSNYVSGYADGTFKGNNPVTKMEFAQMMALNFYTKDNLANADPVNTAKDLERRFGASVYNAKGEPQWWMPAFSFMRGHLPNTGGFIVEPDYPNSKMCRGAVAYSIMSYVDSTALHDKIAQVDAGKVTSVFTDVTKVNKAASWSITVGERVGNEEKISPYRIMEDAIANPQNGVPSEYYAAMILCQERGIMAGTGNNKSDWEKPVTRAQVLQFMANTNAYILTLKK